ncbi:Hypothetical protein ETEE_2394 [Edwardsiella anguillarum ET080813]|uniref:Uncharacterized protein n=1 Tax=Edwardsiella anguillarum ET080813 TaxID=667120 RepID=A0A076LJW5_9GAMM|nr:Hypothetical protein ETEE_2394 [Edwardsiella anguillarum ET080813]
MPILLKPHVDKNIAKPRPLWLDKVFLPSVNFLAWEFVG